MSAGSDAPADPSLALGVTQNRILTLALQDTTLHEALDRIAHAVEAASPSEVLVSILLLDKDGLHLRHGAAPSLPEAYNRAIDGIAVGEGVGSCGTAVHRGEPVYVSSIPADPLWRDFKELAATHDLAACWSTPIRSGGPEVLGTFALYCRTPQAPTPPDIALIDFVAQSVGLLIERRRAEDAVRVSEARYRSLFENVSSGLGVFEVAHDDEGRPVDHRFIDVNPAFASHTGLIDAQGRWASELAPGIEPRWNEVYDRVIKTGEAITFEEFAAPLGRWYEVHVFPLGVGAEGRGAVLFTDISERRAAQVALQELNATLEARVEDRTRERDRLWDVSQDLLVVADWEGRLLRVSPSWTRSLGWSEADLLAEPFAAIIHPDDVGAVLETLGEMRRTGEPVMYENRVRTAQGGWRMIAWSLAPEMGGERFSGVGRDVTRERTRQVELEAAEEALRQSQKLEAVGQLTGGVAHDFNNLLTIISSSAEFLQRPNLSEERRGRYLGAIRETVARASKLTNQLLAFARRQPLKPEVFDVDERVRGTLALVRSLVGARIAIEYVGADPGAIRAYADAAQFETSLVNLLINARDAMDGEGSITVQVFPTDSIPAVRAHLRRPGAFIGVSVADSGTGIDPQKIDTIFEPFFTTKAVGKGTGLGLSQVFGFAKQSQGEVEVNSELGAGAKFTLYLPRSDDLSEIRPAVLAALPRALGDGACVLVVEDNEAVGQFSTEMLHDLGYETTWAGNAAEAMALLMAAKEKFKLVFTDVVMPGTNGIDFAKEVRRRFPNLPVLLTSGYSDVLAQEGAGGFDLVQKPYSVETLSGAIAAALSSVPA